MEIILTQAGTYEVRQELENDKSFIVVPVVMMVEGVHNGSKGAILHTANELSKDVSKWNGTPVTIYHPQDADGKYISVNSSGVEVYGEIRNANWNDKLKAEIWFYAEKIQDSELYMSLQNKQPIDVSVGVFTTDISVEGIWNEETYKAVASNYTPDHLAVLPGMEGACSWNDGCGIRVNQKQNKEEQQVMDKTKPTVLDLEVDQALQVNQTDLLLLVDKIRDKLYAKDSDTMSYFLESVLQNEIIYRVRIYNPETPPYYEKQAYIYKDGGIEFIGEPIEMIKEVTYTPKNQIKTNQKGDNKMTKCKLTKISELIANSATAFAETDREWLSTLEENQLDKLKPVEVVTAVTEADVISYLKDVKEEEVIKLLPEPMQIAVNSAIAEREAKRKEIVTAIMANSAEVWAEEELMAMSCEMLSKIHKSAVKEEIVDYSANGGQPKKQGNEDLPKPLTY